MIDKVTKRGPSGHAGLQIHFTSMPVPSRGLVTGVVFGTTAVATVACILWARHRGTDTVFDAGSQFEMVLQSPLSVDGDRVSAIASANAQ